MGIPGRKIFRPYIIDHVMTYTPDIHHRRSIRLRGYDYSKEGVYFLTLCTKDRACLFGDIADGKMRLNKAGEIVKKCWNDIPSHFQHVSLDEFIIMPNHIHGIVFVGANSYSPPHMDQNTGKEGFSPKRGTAKTIGSVVRGFKIGVTKWMRFNTSIHDAWQRNYWEHIVRNEEELNSIREYIQYNPAQWISDKLYSPCPDHSR
jgi:REP element-mobilizing transposase RayT